MLIKWLEVENFRAFAGVNFFEFGPGVEIVGGNAAGKSSIMEAIAFALAGADKEGKANATDRLMTKGCNEMRLSIGIVVNGQAYEIERQSFKMKNKTESKILINRMNGNQEQIDAIIGDRKNFLAAFLPDYFCNLEQKDARIELMKLLPIPTDEEVKSVMAESEPELLEAIADVKLADPDFFIQNEKTYLKELKEELIRLEGQEIEVKKSLEVEIPDEVNVDTTAIQELKDTILSIESAKPTLIDVTELERKVMTIDAGYKALQRGLVFEEKYIDHACEKCGHVNKVNLNAEQEEKNATISTQMGALLKEKESIASEISEAHRRNAEAKEAFEAANAETLKHLRSELNTLETNLNQVKQHNMRVQLLKDNRAKAVDRVREIGVEMRKTADLIESTERRIKSAKAFNVCRCELQIASVKGSLDRVSIKLFDIVKSTGEIKPVFKLEYDGKEYRVLSTSEKIRCGLEVAKLIRTLTKRSYPVFIDCAESITHFEKPNAQLFVARVAPPIKEFEETAEGELVEIRSTPVPLTVNNIGDVKGE